MKQEILSHQSRSSQVKDYITETFAEEPVAIALARQYCIEKGLKPIQVSLSLGKTLTLICQLKAPKKILEVGTLGGYSTLWLLRGLQEKGKIVTLEREKEHVAVAKENFNRAEGGEKIEVRQGDAFILMEEMIRKKEGPFDLIFVDADKENYSEYLSLSLELSCAGTVLLFDNLIPKRGEIGSPEPTDQEAIAIYECNQKMAGHPRLDTTILPTLVGESARLDGLGLAIVK